MGYPYHAPKTGQATVTASTASVLVAPENPNRKGVTVYNNSTAILYLTLGPASSTTSYTAQLAAGSYYECPYGYSGPVSGVWASVNGSALVTEVY